MAEPHAYEVRPRKDHRGVDLISEGAAQAQGLLYLWVTISIQKGTHS
jgi:hypothetical protein